MFVISNTINQIVCKSFSCIICVNRGAYVCNIKVCKHYRRKRDEIN